jgi:hypothetical protein
VVNKVKYSGKYLTREKKYEDYSGEKVVIISTKLTLNN